MTMMPKDSTKATSMVTMMLDDDHDGIAIDEFTTCSIVPYEKGMSLFWRYQFLSR